MPVRTFFHLFYLVYAWHMPVQRPGEGHDLVLDDVVLDEGQGSGAVSLGDGLIGPDSFKEGLIGPGRLGKGFKGPDSFEGGLIGPAGLEDDVTGLASFDCFGLYLGM